MIRAIEVYEATCDRCGYFGDPQVEDALPPRWLSCDGMHLCPECAA